MIAPTSFFGDYGCHVRILEEARILQQMGHRVTVVTYNKGRDVQGLDVRRTLPVPWHTHYEVGSSRHKLAFDALLALKIGALMMRERPDVIHAHLHEGALIGHVASRLWRVPMLFDFQGSLTNEMVDHHFLHPKGRLYNPLYRLEGLLDRSADAVITSSHLATRLLRNEFGCRQDVVQTVPDCVNADLFRPRVRDEAFYADRASLGLPADAPVIAYVGLLAEYQGLPQLMQAAAYLRSCHPEVYFLVMGYPGVEHYRRQAAQMGMADHMIFTGRMPYEHLARWLGLGDIAVAPKLSATEGCGKILNYMSMAMPTVAFETPVAREYLGEEGIYAQERTGEALASSLARILEMPDRGCALGAQLRKKAIVRYSWAAAGRTITAIYDWMLKRAM